MITDSGKWADRARLSVAAGVLGLLSTHAVASSVTWPDGDGKNVFRDKIEIRNTTGQTANDIQVTVHQKEKDITIEGGKLSSEDFPTAEDKGKTPHTVTAKFSGRDVAPGEEITIEWEIDLTQKNKRWATWFWTRDCVQIGRKEKGHGHKVKAPAPGGDGGVPTWDGGGRGGQQGGGGTGFFNHPFYFCNEFDEPMEVTELYLLASMEYYDSLDDIPWDLVSPIDLGAGLVIPGGECWMYDFNTTGSYLDGHVYFRYAYALPETPGGPFIQVVKGVGDHPVTPEPTTGAGVLLAVAFLSRYLVKRKAR